ncbi:MAG: hypothetical protein ACMUIP_17600 [bacterium]
MSKSLTEIAQQMIDANKKVQLIYAFIDDPVNSLDDNHFARGGSK